jgi:colanic acid/amylovoran biosynthesis glycosyltransferase
MTFQFRRNPAQPIRVGYVLKRFPRLSETFILNEMLELERQGVEIEVFSLFRPPDERKHALLSQLRARVTYLPSSARVETIAVKRSVEGLAPVQMTLANAIGCSAFDDVMPGRSGAETAALVVKGSVVAMLARTHNLDHLHAHFGSDATTVALMASRLSNLSFSFTAHAKDIYHTYIDAATDKKMRCAKITEASFVVTVSDFNRRHLVEMAGKSTAEKVHQLYNGVDLARFNYSTKSRVTATILSVGRLVEKKGYSDLIEACHLLHNSGVRFKCHIVGDGPLGAELSQQIMRAGLENNVRLLGARSQEELILMMREAMLFVLPCVVTESGDRDGLPTVLLEALASGLPSISTLVSGVPEIIEHGKSGLLVEPTAPAQLAEAIKNLLEHAELRQNFAEQGRQKAERDFDLVKNVGTLRGYFERSIAASSGGLIASSLRVG